MTSPQISSKRTKKEEGSDDSNCNIAYHDRNSVVDCIKSDINNNNNNNNNDNFYSKNNAVNPVGLNFEASDEPRDCDLFAELQHKLTRAATGSLPSIAAAPALCAGLPLSSRISATDLLTSRGKRWQSALTSFATTCQKTTVDTSYEFDSSQRNQVDDMPKPLNSIRNSQDVASVEASDEFIVQTTKVHHESTTTSMGVNNNDYTCNPQKDVIFESKQQRSRRASFIEIDPIPDDIKRASFMIHLCTATYSLMPLASAIVAAFLIGLLLTSYRLFPLVYFAYVIYTRNVCNRGGNRVDFVYKSKFWSYLAAYFPIKVRYSSQFALDPKENYILNYHPHGISAFASVAGLATNGLNFDALFPGIERHFMVHETSFVTPVMRETFGLRGDCSVNSKSIDYMLKNRRGQLLTIVGGGLAEADLSHPETLKVVVATRKGLVKKALIHGAHLIPCLSLGENSVFTKYNLQPGSFLYKLESLWYKMLKFKHPIYLGQSCFFPDKFRGTMPYRRPITLVMGDPIRVECKATPTQDDIDTLHQIYLQRLRLIYESNKDLCHTYDKELLIV